MHWFRFGLFLLQILMKSAVTRQQNQVAAFVPFVVFTSALGNTRLKAYRLQV
jgi:hypothetical protein